MHSVVAWWGWRATVEDAEANDKRQTLLQHGERSRQRASVVTRGAKASKKRATIGWRAASAVTVVLVGWSLVARLVAAAAGCGGGGCALRCWVSWAGVRHV